jgi:hypothetical protein
MSRLVSFTSEGRFSYGVVIDGGILDLGGRCALPWLAMQ